MSVHHPPTLVRRLMRRLTRPAAPPATPEPTYDVTGFSNDIDLAALDVIAWAPCWMSRAERLMLYALVFALRPERYLEIGTFKGGSALIVAAALDAVGAPGRMVCVDDAPQVDPAHWARVAPRATLLTGTSPGILPQARAAAGAPFDFVLIDGDHSYDGVSRDARAVLRYVVPGGRIVCHDGHNPGVAHAIRDFVAEYRAEVTDCGIFTREITYVDEGNGVRQCWGGLHVLRRGAAP